MINFWRTQDFIKNLKARKLRKEFVAFMAIELGIEAPIIDEAIDKFIKKGALSLYQKIFKE